MSSHLALVMKSHAETKQAMQEQAVAHQSETRDLKARIDQLQVVADAQRTETERLRARIGQHLQLRALTHSSIPGRQQARICRAYSCSSVAANNGYCYDCYWQMLATGQIPYHFT